MERCQGLVSMHARPPCASLLRVLCPVQAQPTASQQSHMPLGRVCSPTQLLSEAMCLCGFSYLSAKLRASGLLEAHLFVDARSLAAITMALWSSWA
eukprot:122259-Pelagomonas_calceolata.AAC.5